MYEISEGFYRPENPESKVIKSITLNGEPVIFVFGKTENDVENFAKRIAGLLEASVGLHYEIAIRLMQAARDKWQPTDPPEKAEPEPDPNPDE